MKIKRKSLQKKSIRESLSLSESQIQIDCFEWFNLQYPKELIFHIPNAVKYVSRGNRGAFYGILKKMKDEGVVKGIPDLFLAKSFNKYHGLFIEMKKPKSYASKEQKEIHYLLAKNGYAVAVVKSFDAFVILVTTYFSSGDLDALQLSSELQLQS